MRFEEAAKLAKLLASKKNIRVQMDGAGRAWTEFRGDEYLIGLPVPADGRFDKYIHGYLDHETGHVKWTDFELMKYLNFDAMELLNIYEDEYVERKMGELYPGAKDNLRELALKIFKCKVPDYLLNALKDGTIDSGRRMALAKYTLLYVRRARLVPEFADHANAMRKILRHELGDGRFADDADNLLDAECDSTADSLKWARKWDTLLGMYARVNPDNLLSSGKDDKQDGDSMPDDSQSDEDGKQDNANMQQAGNSNGGKSVRDIIESLQEDDPGNNFMPEVGSAMTQALGADNLANKEARDDIYFFNKKEGREPVRYNKHNWSKGRGNLRNDIPVMAARITRTLMPLLQHETYKPARPDYSGKTLARRRLYKVPTGCADVFMTKAVQRQVNTDIKILCDISYSMNEEGRYDAACLGLLAIYKALNGQRGISIEVGYFDDFFSMADDADLRKYITARPSGYTEMGNGMIKMLGKFTNSQKRRIMIVLTDGDTSDPLLVRAVINKAKAEGVELYGLGMMSKTLNNYDMPSIAVDKSSEIPDALVQLLKNAMLNRRAA